MQYNSVVFHKTKFFLVVIILIYFFSTNVYALGNHKLERDTIECQIMEQFRVINGKVIVTYVFGSESYVFHNLIKREFFGARKIAKKFDLTLPQTLILFNISINGTSMSDLAHLMGLDPSTITRNIEKLEIRNLLYRERSLNDTRMIYIYKSSCFFPIY